MLFFSAFQKVVGTKSALAKSGGDVPSHPQMTPMCGSPFVPDSPKAPETDGEERAARERKITIL